MKIDWGRLIVNMDFILVLLFVFKVLTFEFVALMIMLHIVNALYVIADGR